MILLTVSAVPHNDWCGSTPDRWYWFHRVDSCSLSTLVQSWHAFAVCRVYLSDPGSCRLLRFSAFHLSIRPFHRSRDQIAANDMRPRVDDDVPQPCPTDFVDVPKAEMKISCIKQKWKYYRMSTSSNIIGSIMLAFNQFCCKLVECFDFFLLSGEWFFKIFMLFDQWFNAVKTIAQIVVCKECLERYKPLITRFFPVSIFFSSFTKLPDMQILLDK